jgi:alanine-glyoxylate transaminase/serine-glyoxylate transaminase/serine-pyruvate transaminase
MSPLPDHARILLGPGPSMTAPRVMRAMAAPTVSHLDPLLLAMLDDVRARLGRLFKAPDDSLAFAISGTGTSGMEAAVANLVKDGTSVVAVVNGYFSDRLARMCERYGGSIRRVEVEWGRACDPDVLRRALAVARADLVTIVHAETSTGVLNPLPELAAVARAVDALVLVDAVTSFGGHPLDVGGWGIDVAYSCTQKCLGAPSGLAPIVFTPRALERRVACRSFYLDLGLLQDYWLNRKYHHTISSVLVYALAEALTIVEEEGLEERWRRHERHHRLLIDRLASRGLSVLPPESERLWTLNAVKVPAGIDEARVRRDLLEQFGIEIGAGLGPLAGAIWRVGLMGTSSSASLVMLLTAALEQVVEAQRVEPSVPFTARR